MGEFEGHKFEGQVTNLRVRSCNNTLRPCDVKERRSVLKLPPALPLRWGEGKVAGEE